MTDQKHGMTEAQEAEYLYAHGNDHDLAGEEVDLKPAEPLTMVMSVRLREAEMPRPSFGRPPSMQPGGLQSTVRHW